MRGRTCAESSAPTWPGYLRLHMAIFKWLQRLLWACRTNVLTPDPVLDNLIREALVEQALHSAIPVTTWDRVRRSLLERRLAHRSGMWVLDEPLREPPEAA